MTETAWQVLAGLAGCQVTEIPRWARADAGLGGQDGDRDVLRRLSALVSAFHYGSAVGFGWVRERAGGPVRVLAAGPALAGGADGGQVVLTLPAGARGSPLPAGGAAAAAGQMPCWVRLAGFADGLLAGEDLPGDAARLIRPCLEDGLLAVWGGPFGWLVLAVPVGMDAAEELVAGVALAQLRAQRSDSPAAQIAARRLRARHDELRQAAATGLWRVHVLAGGQTPRAAAQVAGMLAASADLAGLPYALAPLPGCASLGEILGGPAGGAGAAVAGRAGITGPEVAAGGQDRPEGPEGPGEDGAGAPRPRSPFFASSKLVAALARPPAREVPGVRLVLRPDFDVTPETAIPQALTPRTAAAGAGARAGVPVGVVLDGNRVPAGELMIPGASLNRHVFVCGATGAGKSQTVRALLEAAGRAGVPWLVIEPAKAEYAAGMAARLGGDGRVVRVRLGAVDQLPAGINPLEPAAGPGGARFPLQTHADLIRALFVAAFAAEEPFPQVLAGALVRCYEGAGWDLATGEPAVAGMRPGYPGLGDVQAAAMQVVQEIGYGREVTDNVRGFVTVRIASLRLGTAGRFLDGGHLLDFDKLLDTNVVLEIEDAGDDAAKAFVMGTVLIRLAGHLRMRACAGGPGPASLRHLTVIEEAHRLLRKPAGHAAYGPAAAHAVEMFAALLAEIRAYGEGLVIAEQIPAKLADDVIKNTAVKIVHRLPAADDRQAVGATMNLTDAQSQYLVTLRPGEAAVFTDGMDYPLLARMPDGTPRETARPAPVSSPAAIITPRSTACGPACQTAPCTLRQMAAAQHTATATPAITLWAELSVLAHLAGWHMPLPASDLEQLLAALPARLRDCALAHAAGTAAAARAPVISSRVPAPALAAHVTAAMRTALDDRQWLCGKQEPQWLAPPYRWMHLLDSLRAYHASEPGAGRHPRSPEWEATCGRPIPGTTCAAQLKAVQRWHDDAQRDQRALHAVAYGTRAPSAVECAVGARTGDGDWAQRLTAALSAFHDCRWPLDYLRPAPASSDQRHVLPRGRDQRA